MPGDQRVFATAVGWKRRDWLPLGTTAVLALTGRTLTLAHGPEPEFVVHMSDVQVTPKAAGAFVLRIEDREYSLFGLSPYARVPRRTRGLMSTYRATKTAELPEPRPSWLRRAEVEDTRPRGYGGRVWVAVLTVAGAKR